MKCSNCGKEKVHAKGFCGSCYIRWLKTGDPAKTKVKNVSNCSFCGEYGPIAARGYCKACYARYRKHGTPERINIKKRQPCAFCGVESEIKALGLCSKCYDRKREHGTPEYLRVRHICSVDGCESTVKSNGLCAKHHQRWKRHSSTDNTRPKGWGARKNHPLTHAYDHHIRRNKKYEVCEKWKKDFWAFVKDVGDRPTPEHRLKRIDEYQPLSEVNFKWELPLISNPNTPATKEARAAYAREYRQLNQRKIKNSSLKKYFGITIDQFESMVEKQRNKCAICGEEEKSVNPMTMKKNSLSIDHCHKTGKIRGLLCSACNTAIGLMKESDELFARATRYLRYYKNTEICNKVAQSEQQKLGF